MTKAQRQFRIDLAETYRYARLADHFTYGRLYNDQGCCLVGLPTTPVEPAPLSYWRARREVAQHLGIHVRQLSHLVCAHDDAARDDVQAALDELASA